MRIDLVSPMSPVAAATRLKEKVAVLTVDAPRCVTGNGTDREMTLWVHRPRTRNDFKPLLKARLDPFEGGTRLRGRIGAPRSVGLFMGCWVTFVSLFLAFGLILLLSSSGATRWTGLGFVAIPGLMLAMAGAMIGMTRAQTRGDREEMLAFLRETIGARPRDGRDL
ncbi:hypothetical protein [Sphingomonas sp.]|uniref:hypothetical protein n=1 Tax=Sphingomonas sp. TaxID=28214 RepID=UPI001ED4853F|nr:hypothetical protein [Sphingomonas sp.]MBX3592905.1 hypothetical protein [Sphingomonas sp.]